ncbi:uncharacterized protein PHACADRAFT_30209 [Phanerochaete carnosa HHB-10118-sp]|uniref:DUF6570 domain-containing protein n=1 Tax=Phanerochaete carnosa (strain HHB-10118-sp) TaxID=650164 RepID=K5W223_PHACS|nr:uncharacterized protein PHACADRAFT_30209 [Phanerochaete carnosa HHB-10118-sp]EKM53170.1 hypothetical protein PHACADRAFT_30209 [Phanerochaete carnosa HHB-10118-sp]
MGEVPAELCNLRLVEKIMIAHYQYNVCVVTIATSARKMHANAVVFSQPVPKFYHKLPSSRDEVSDVLAVLFTGPCRPTKTDFKQMPLLIRKDHVLAALHWLKVHHPLYQNLEILLDNLQQFSETSPPVDWYYQSSAGDAPVQSMSVSDKDKELA